MIHPFADVMVGLVKIPVTDFAKARHFWKEVVGLQEELRSKTTAGRSSSAAACRSAST
jgi:extradiol dioxygenase family protein